ncbi:MAG: GAF domain-containing SpoIIE family protein phosphatase [Halanaerobiales bacterium]
MKFPVLKEIEESFAESWKRIVKILGEVLNTEVVLINSVSNQEIEILKSGSDGKKYFSDNKVYNLKEVYCEEVVKNKEMLEINNANRSNKWRHYPAAKRGLVSYLGYPILNPEGKVIGTICVEDNKERYFSESEKDLIFQFKEVIENQISQLELTRKLENNLEKGKKLHEQYLPSHLPDIEGLNFGTYYQAAEKLGGDFYDIIELEDIIVFYISDVSGHDLSSAMLNIFLKETIQSYLIHNQKEKDMLVPAKIIHYINENFVEEKFPVNYFISMILGTIKKENFKIKLCNAGFQFLPLISREDGSVFNLFCKGRPITVLNDEVKYDECSYYFRPGDILYLNTDGIFEQTDSEGNFYDESRLIKLISKNSCINPDEILQKIYGDFFHFKQDMSIQDDLTSLLIQRV